MKDNRKNRKKAYIKVKNGLRLGKGSFRAYFKVAEGMPAKLLDDIITRAEEMLLKKYKLVLPLKGVATGHDDNDLAMDMYTILVEFEKGSNYDRSIFKIA